MPTWELSSLENLPPTQQWLLSPDPCSQNDSDGHEVPGIIVWDPKASRISEASGSSVSLPWACLAHMIGSVAFFPYTQQKQACSRKALQKMLPFRSPQVALPQLQLFSLGLGERAGVLAGC